MFSSAIAVGDENNNSESTQSSTATLEKRKPDVPKGPRVPSRVYIECSYGVGYVEFTLPVECEYMEVTLEQNGVQVYYGVVTPEEPCAEIPVLSGECTVTCHTDGNQTYSGVLFF